MTTILRPFPFLIGLVAGLAGLATLGATLESWHLTSNFVRYHQRNSPEAGYFPTAREVVSIVRAHQALSPKVYVIVGGSSVFNGAGQRQPLIWTRFLQESLGPQFRVINLATRGGVPHALGEVASEWLVSRGLPVIYLANGTPQSFSLKSQLGPHSYLLFDAWQRGYLLPWPARDRHFRSAVLETSAGVREAALGAVLNSYLNFNDFWNFFTYEIVNLNWNFVYQPNPFQPRYQLEDPDMTQEVSTKYLLGTELRRQLDILQREAREPSDYSAAAARIEAMMPDRLRAVTLAVINGISPYYIERLDPDDQRRILDKAHQQAEVLKSTGFRRALLVGEDFTAEDYVDRIHPSVAGGQKSARILAPEIVSMARQLGYIP